MHKGQSSNMKHTKRRYKADNTGSEGEHTYIPTLILYLSEIELAVKTSRAGRRPYAAILYSQL